MSEPEIKKPPPSGFQCPHCKQNVTEIIEIGFLSPKGFLAKAYACHDCVPKAKASLFQTVNPQWN